MRNTWIRRLRLACLVLLAFSGSVLAQSSITISPATLPDGAIGLAYNETLTADSTGALPPYTFSVAPGTLPPGLTLGSDGALFGTPTTTGVFSFTVLVEDFDATSNGSQFYEIEIFAEATIEPPNLAQAQVGVPYEQALTVQNGGAPAYTFGVSAGALPAGLTLAGNGVISGTPTAAGDAAFTISAMPSLVVVTEFAPTAAPVVSLSRSYTLSVAPVSIQLPADPLPDGVVGTAYAYQFEASDGVPPYFYYSATSLPPGLILEEDGLLHGTPTIEGPYSFGVMAYDSSEDSTSRTYAITINGVEPLPEAMALEATTLAGVPVSVELTTGASGGPFTSAELVSLTPSESGTAVVAASADGHGLTFTPADGFVGVAVASFTLGNDGGTSEPATLTITVTERPDPGDDPEVGGLVGTQAQIVRSFSDAQILNAVNRLELLHEPGKPLTFWIGGSIRKGDSPGREFETSGVTGGMDYRFSDKFAFGGGLGYGRDRSMVGDNGSRADARSKTGMGYASYRPSLPWFIDMVSGYQRITFQLRRFVTGSGDMLEAPRDGDQAFSSWSSGYERKGEKWLLSAYGRMDVAQAKLDEYSEDGNPLYALSFDEQSIQTRTSTVGMRGKYKRETPWGTLEPRFRVELQRDFHDESGAAITYSDLQSGPVYVLPGDELDRSRYIIEIGTIFKSKWGFVMRLDYRGVRGGLYDDDNAVMFSFQDDH